HDRPRSREARSRSPPDLAKLRGRDVFRVARRARGWLARADRPRGAEGSEAEAWAAGRPSAASGSGGGGSYRRKEDRPEGDQNRPAELSDVPGRLRQILEGAGILWQRRGPADSTVFLRARKGRRGHSRA